MRQREYGIMLTAIDTAAPRLQIGDRVEIIGKTPDTGDTLVLTERGRIEYVAPQTVGADTPYNRHRASCDGRITRSSPEGFTIIEECSCGARFHHHPSFANPITLR